MPKARSKPIKKVMRSKIRRLKLRGNGIKNNYLRTNPNIIAHGSKKRQGDFLATTTTTTSTSTSTTSTTTV